MNYQTVLQNYLPVEQGDFMLKYEIDDRGYAIYSPEKGSFSCIELHGFSELTPWQLAFLLSLDMQQMKEQDEFSLSVCCKREKLLSYLFDVEESETTLKTKHVSGWQGYLMMDIHKPDRVRNVFQFHPETKKARLVFDNRLCVASLREKEKGKIIHLCWSPSLFAAIDRGGSWAPSRKRSLLTTVWITVPSTWLCTAAPAPPMKRSHWQLPTASSR